MEEKDYKIKYFLIIVSFGLLLWLFEFFCTRYIRVTTDIWTSDVGYLMELVSDKSYQKNMALQTSKLILIEYTKNKFILIFNFIFFACFACFSFFKRVVNRKEILILFLLIMVNVVCALFFAVINKPPKIDINNYEQKVISSFYNDEVTVIDNINEFSRGRLKYDYYNDMISSEIFVKFYIQIIVMIYLVILFIYNKIKLRKLVSLLIVFPTVYFVFNCFFILLFYYVYTDKLLIKKEVVE